MPLPSVTEDTYNSIMHDLKESADALKNRDDFLKRLKSKNQYLFDWILGYLEAMAQNDGPVASEKARKLVFLAIRMIESQIEADDMANDIKLG